jgi:hypothetical protein
MKNLYKFLGIAVLALAIVFSFAACNNSTSSGGGGGGGGPNTDPKVIKITGIPNTEYNAYKTSRAWLLVVPEGSVTGNNPYGKDIAYSINLPDYIATLPSNTLNLGLYKTGSSDTRWTESGKYDLWLLEGNDTTIAQYKYKASSIDISTATTTLVFNDSFTKVN